jgi:hypothetical protein
MNGVHPLYHRRDALFPQRWLVSVPQIGDDRNSAKRPPNTTPAWSPIWRWEMRRVIGCMGCFVLLLLSVSIAQAAPTTAWPSQHAALLTFTPPAHTVSNSVPAAKKWTFEGCWSPRTGSPCLDVYRDPQGGLWICKACGTTGNPGPGKCRSTTQAELDSGRWCS